MQHTLPGGPLRGPVEPAGTVYRKIALRIVPLLFLCYMLNYMDRVNVGYAQLQMKHALAFSDAIYGLGASIFFVGYFLFEVPSNLLLHRIGARKTLLRIMLGWGLLSAATAFVRTPTHFYVARFFLGVFEAGLFPGIILYLTYWFPVARRARVVSLFMIATAAAGLVGGPLSGWILQNMNGVSGMGGWQWMFLIEGLPSSVLGIVCFLYLVDSPDKAKWLTPAESAMVIRDVNESLASAQVKTNAQRSAFADPKVYLLSFVLYTMLCGSYGLTFWLPTVIRELGVSNLQKVGLYAMLPEALACVSTVLYSRHSDRYLERRWHFVIAALVAAAALSAASLFSTSLPGTLTLFAIARAAIVSSLPVFWAMSTALLSERSSVAGIAVISSLSNLSGMTAPYLFGVIRSTTGSLSLGLYIISGLIVLAAICVLARVPRASTMGRLTAEPDPTRV
ncbi:Putative metabolite transport protein NicT [Paraburkholderia unamae]|uniref:MFS transporter n=1 Tax=Paraburkholderia unamae TaxID=219649 RepID=UPI001CAD18DD|nr:MFS transporter [Paraburkholderia unamae]CAG9266091.1 Putative metabolite transport protein NicT [Paraburkholderia unamae]